MTAGHDTQAVTTAPRLLSADGRRHIAAITVVGLFATLPFSASIASIFVALVAIATIVASQRADLRHALARPAALTGLALFAWMVVAILWSSAAPLVWVDELEAYLKLLFIPLLFAAFGTGDWARRVLIAFLMVTSLILTLSWLGYLTGITVPKIIEPGGIVVGDHSIQSILFLWSAFALAHLAWTRWRDSADRHDRILAVLFALLALLFLSNIIFVATARATLIAFAVLTVLFTWQRFGLRGLIGGVVVVAVLAALVWQTSPKIRDRVQHARQDISRYMAEDTITSIGVRLQLWHKGAGFVTEAPVVGHGTGSLIGLYQERVTDTEPVVTDDSHNQILQVAISYGLVGAVLLIAMWLSHAYLFRGGGIYAWVGQAVVAQNVVTGQFHSHIWMFTPGWYYVLAIGVLGAAVIARRRDEAL